MIIDLSHDNMDCYSMAITIFKANNAPIALIVCRFNVDGKQRWQLIKWNINKITVGDQKKETVIADKFTEGQWIINKQLWRKGCAISPDGQYFYWIYNRYQSSEGMTHAGISVLPNFTAIMYGSKGNGRWDDCRFDKKTGKPINNQGLEPKGATKISCVSKGARADNGMMPATWTDDFGRTITVDGYKLSANGIVIYDATNNTFKETEPL